MLDTIVGQYYCGEFVQEREVVQFTDLIVAQIDALEKVKGCPHVLYLGKFVPTQVELPLI